MVTPTGEHPPLDTWASPKGSRLRQLSLAALGVVFGDIATSPLYALRECFHGEYGIAPSPENVLGVLSLVFWTLVLVVTVKYLGFILKADNHGEGGVIALAALLKPGKVQAQGVHRLLISLGLFGGCLLYGDGMITPAISVLSAVEGIRIITPLLSPYVIPLTAVILAGLFLLQHWGTTQVGRLFGPLILLWLGVLAGLGGAQIVQQPAILAALSPWPGLHFLLLNRLHGFIVLGGVFLVVTGAEALYADMGHFGKRPIRLTWLILVFPALLLNYFGQGAILLTQPEQSYHPFYALAPPWALIPLTLLATLATIIASQAVITGSFSLTRQAMQLGYLPRLRIAHTSASQIGQIYVAPVNWLLMLCTIGLVFGFKSSSNLAAAYGVAVTATMLLTTILFYVVARRVWGWSRLLTGSVASVFFVIDLAFFSANATKIFHGAWFPLVIGAAIFTMMSTWKEGRKILGVQLSELTPPFETFRANLAADPPHKITGQAIFFAGQPNRVPPALVQNLTHNKIIHSETVLLHINTEEVPRVPNFDKVTIERLGGGFHRVTVRYGFMEEPKIDKILALMHEKGLDFKKESTSYFLGRVKLAIGPNPKMGRWRAVLFRFMANNAIGAAAYYGLPTDQVIEVGVQLEL
jgi:KUP system potassium uptake protein